MRIKRKYLALVVAIILLAASAISFSVYQTIEDNRVAYITVKMDKHTFSAGENVTFRLEAVSEDVKFNITDLGTVNSYNLGGVIIYRIPDDMDPEDLFDGTVGISQLNYNFLEGAFSTRAHYDHFDSEEGPLEMTWNGSMFVFDHIFKGSSYQPATSGYYLIVPDLDMGNEDHVVCILDENAVFYYDSFDLKLDIVNNPDTNITVTMSMQAAPGTEGEISADLYTELCYYYNEEGEEYDPQHQHNETGLTIIADSWTNVTFSFDVAVPDHGYLVGDSESFTNVQFYGTLVTSQGNYTFDFSAYWNGGWENIYQY